MIVNFIQTKSPLKKGKISSEILIFFNKSRVRMKRSAKKEALADLSLFMALRIYFLAASA